MAPAALSLTGACGKPTLRGSAVDVYEIERESRP